MPRVSKLERFMSHIDPCPTTGCWLWTGCLKTGYGYFRWDNSCAHDRAHHAAWRLFKGEIPQGMYVLHRCDVMACANPNHLWLGTQRDNVLDMYAKGRNRHYNALKTHCKRGHELSGDNLIILDGDGRWCRTCKNMLAGQYRERKRIRELEYARP